MLVSTAHWNYSLSLVHFFLQHKFLVFTLNDVSSSAAALEVSFEHDLYLDGFCPVDLSELTTAIVSSKPSIHHLPLPLGIGSRGQQLELRNPDVSVPDHFHQLFWGGAAAFPG